METVAARVGKNVTDKTFAHTGVDRGCQALKLLVQLGQTSAIGLKLIVQAVSIRGVIGQRSR